MAALCPSPPEIDAIGDLDTLAAAAAVAAPDWAAFLAALGGPTDVKTLVYVDRTSWDATARATRLAAVGTAAPAPLNPLALASLERARIFVRAKYGLLPDGVCATPAMPALAPSQPQPQQRQEAAEAPTEERKFKNVIDPTKEGSMTLIESAKSTEMYAKYKVLFGDFPTSRVEPSPAQLSGVNTMIEAGENPYVDFSVFGPHGRRALKRLTYHVQAFQPDTGKYVRQELNGPNDLTNWMKCWQVFRTTMLLLTAAMCHSLDAYSEFIREKVATYGQKCWDIIYQADMRMRLEEFERIRRREDIAYQALTEAETLVSKYDPRKPWNRIFALAVSTSCPEAMAFWQTECVEKCQLLVAGAASPFKLLHDETTLSCVTEKPTKKPKWSSLGEQSPNKGKGKGKGKGKWSYKKKTWQSQQWQQRQWQAPVQQPPAPQAQQPAPQQPQQQTTPFVQAGQVAQPWKQDKGKGKGKGKGGKGKKGW